MKKITVALAGNPNSGKTTVFNMLTGARQHVANYPGVTVEQKEGFRRYDGYEIRFIDLPGTYSLDAYSIEELVARDFIIDEHPDVVVDVVDSSNIERNLYLATQLIEMDVPLVLAFNMSDIARLNGLVFDIDEMSELLEAEIVLTVGSKGRGGNELLAAILRTAEKEKTKRSHKISYGREINEKVAELSGLIEQIDNKAIEKYHPDWLAIKLLERDKQIAEKIKDDTVKQKADESIKEIKAILGDELEVLMADRRYGFISGACQETIKKTVEFRHSFSDTIDSVLTNQVLGLPIFLFLMFVVFQITFAIGSYPMGWLESFFDWLCKVTINYWPGDNMLWLRSLLVEGVIRGVGGVVMFLPNILLLFASIAILEATGYMARAAFIMDRVMHKIGLHGKSFIPMIIGFGCSVPAIMATRILENRRNRFTTIMVIPLMSCGAKFAIYALLIPAFFPLKWQGTMLWLIYVVGIIIAIICVKILRLTVFKGETTPFVMELPPYRMPTFKALGLYTWQRGWMYLKKAGTIILLMSIILWFAKTYPKPAQESLQGLNAQQVHEIKLSSSVVGRIGKTIEPAIKPLGFDWKIGTALVGSVAAKELFITQLSIVYAVDSDAEQSHNLRYRLRETYTEHRPLMGFCIMLFCLISSPCVATVVMTKQETGSWGWAMFQFFGLTILAYIVTLIVYQVGILFVG